MLTDEGNTMNYTMIDAADLHIRSRSASASIDDRLWARVKRGTANECWPWTAHTSKDGYGKVRYAGQLMYVHRLAYIETFGPVPDGTEIDHTCHNGTNCTIKPCPHRACCNPAHLEAVVHATNTERGNVGMVSASRRGKTRVTHCRHGHEYTEENTFTYVNAKGYTTRQCRQCNREKGRRFRAEKRRT